MSVPWTVSQLTILRTEYPTCTDIAALAERIGKPEKTVVAKASLLGVKRLVKTSRKKAKVVSRPIVKQIVRVKMLPDVQPPKEDGLGKIESQLLALEDSLSSPCDMKEWVKMVREYHYLSNRLCQLKGIRLTADYGISEHII